MSDTFFKEKRKQQGYALLLTIAGFLAATTLGAPIGFLALAKTKTETGANPFAHRPMLVMA